MNSIKAIIEYTSVKHLCLASNMISGVGLEIVTETICANTTLISLDVRSEDKN